MSDIALDLDTSFDPPAHLECSLPIWQVCFARTLFCLKAESSRGNL